MRRSTENDPARLAHQCRDVGLFDPEDLAASVCMAQNQTQGLSTPHRDPLCGS